MISKPVEQEYNDAKDAFEKAERDLEAARLRLRKAANAMCVEFDIHMFNAEYLAQPRSNSTL